MSDVPYDELDPPIRELVLVLNEEFGGIETIGSCGGHEDGLPPWLHELSALWFARGELVVSGGSRLNPSAGSRGTAVGAGLARHDGLFPIALHKPSRTRRQRFNGQRIDQLPSGASSPTSWSKISAHFATHT